MRYWTWSEIKTKVEEDLDLQDETFIQPDELLGYANEAIKEAESEIHKLYEDYFLSSSPITLVSGTSEYAYPSNVYAMKIRRIIYQNGALIYRLDRIRNWQKFEKLTIMNMYQGGSGNYGWMTVNRTAGEPKIILAPVPLENGQFLTVWYIRTANELVEDTDICDIPEFVYFVMQYMKVRCYEKEGHPNLPNAVAMLEAQREQMLSTLQDQTPDAADEIEADMSYYEEMV